MPRLDTASVAGLFADRSRVAMIDVLTDSREHAVGALARAAGVAVSTATEELSRPEDGGVVWYAALVDSVSSSLLVRRSLPRTRRGPNSRASARRTAFAGGGAANSSAPEGRATTTSRGRLGVAIADAALAAGAVEPDFSPPRGARAWFD